MTGRRLTATFIDYDDQREMARERLRNPLPQFCRTPRSHRWTDVNDPPLRERLVCYRCGVEKARVR